MKNLIIFVIFLFSLISCEIYAVIDENEPIIVIEKLPLNRYKCKYKHANRTYYMHLVSDELYHVGDTLKINKK